MAQADHRAGSSASPGKRLILIANPYLSFFTFIAIAILAYLTNILHSYRFSVPSSFLVSFITIFAAFSLFLSLLDPPQSSSGAVA